MSSTRGASSWRYHTATGVLGSWMLIAAVLVAPVSAVADVDATLENDHTGADSDNDNDLTANTSISFTFTNVGTVENDLDLTLNTGGNTVDSNTTVGDITTGDITVDAVLENIVNEVSPMSMLSDLTMQAHGPTDDISIQIVNAHTGAGSTNTNTADVTRDETVAVTNDATATNTLTLDVNTGDNTIANNTTVGDITTGDIDVSIRGENRLNAPPKPTPPPPVQPSLGGLGGVGGGGIAPLTPLPTFVDQPSVVVASLPAAPAPTTVAQAPTPTQPAVVTQLMQPKQEFFPAGAALDGLTVLLFLVVALLLAYAPELLTVLRRQRGLLYPSLAVLPLL
ncbi:hypothetical protein HY375_02185 [Candidatus Berkelbacteria bacterium]|nr:hypothetical protein [Candidatus Berkelbacteria bacterium]